jgi:hypothetical protein
MTDIRKIVVDYEAMYFALVRRLVEIADAKDGDAVDDWARVGCYDIVAHAHEPNLPNPRT